MDKSEIKYKIQQAFLDVFQDHCETDARPIVSDEMVLLESGLDSLGFAILVVRLEDELGYDPFTESDEAYYPQTFEEFVEFYARNQPK